MINYYQNKVECFSKSLVKANNIDKILKELTEFNIDFQDSKYHNTLQKSINNYSGFSKNEIKRFKQNLITYLFSFTDFKWYHNYPVFTDEMFSAKNLKIPALNLLKSNYLILFQYSSLKNGFFSRYQNYFRRRFDILNNKPSGNTIGMRTAHIKVELLGLLNEISVFISEQYGRTIKIQVNSLIRTIEHQEQYSLVFYNS